MAWGTRPHHAGSTRVAGRGSGDAVLRVRSRGDGRRGSPDADESGNRTAQDPHRGVVALRLGCASLRAGYLPADYRTTGPADYRTTGLHDAAGRALDVPVRQ